MRKLKISMLGAGSGFVINIANELVRSDFFSGSEFMLMDTDQDRLDKAVGKVRELLDQKNSNIKVNSTTELKSALDGCDYVIASCETNRNAFWVKDVEIPQNYGVFQLTGENGGPGGQIHAIRNISMFMSILAEMERYCPTAWLMNFTNPMSFICTYFKNYAKNPALGFCHQVHGSFGVIAEMLGFEPGELDVISGGINHFNWLFDIRLRGTNRSFKKEFFEMVRHSKYWKEKHDAIPRQEFTLEILETFGEYCIGYDDHIVEYLPFFYEKNEWEKHGYESIITRRLLSAIEQGQESKTLEAQTLIAEGRYRKYPFPANYNHPYYAEKPCAAIESLETDKLTYLDAINIVNHGSISNLPENAIVDVPAVIKGGQVRGIHVGELPLAPMELCRRQITIHEMIAKATHEGDENLVIQSLCLDPYVRSISQAKKIWFAFKSEYKDCLPMFK